MKIVVLAGGLSPERNVSLSSGTMIAHALRGLGHQAALVDMYFGLEAYTGPVADYFDAPLTDQWKQVDPKAPDLAEIRAAGSGRAPASLARACWSSADGGHRLSGSPRDLRGGRTGTGRPLISWAFPTAGAGYLGSGLAMDKDLTKRLIAHLGVHTPQWQRVSYTEQEVEDLACGHPGALRGEAGGQRFFHRRVHRPHQAGAPRGPDGGTPLRRPVRAGAVCGRPGDSGGHSGRTGAALH